MTRETYLAGLPTDAPYFDPCRCLKVPGYSLDPESNFWVCGICRKPAAGNPHYNPVCLGCDIKYTRATDKDSEELCPECLTS